MTRSRFLVGHHPSEGALFAGIDPTARHIVGKVAQSRFAAYLAPYADEASARAALIAAGAQNIEDLRTVKTSRRRVVSKARG